MFRGNVKLFEWEFGIAISADGLSNCGNKADDYE